MLPILQRRFEALEESKASTLRQIETVAPSRREERPAPEQWSVSELLSHIAKVESNILIVVRQNLHSPAPVTYGDRFGSMIVRNVMRSPLRIKVPQEVKEVLPDVSVTTESALASWEIARQAWKDLLRAIEPSQLSGGVFSHPRGGWFTLPETVLFLRLHHDHHRPQFARIARALASRA